LATLGNWKRSDGKEQDYESSDGYGTGFVIYVLRSAGTAAEDPRIRKGIAWLKSHQRASGRWFTRSLNRDKTHLLTQPGTAYAVLALALCGEAEHSD
jgi:squalene-hopene/tetraprenyl-beta-curcumene cyclase